MFFTRVFCPINIHRQADKFELSWFGSFLQYNGRLVDDGGGSGRLPTIPRCFGKVLENKHVEIMCHTHRCKGLKQHKHVTY